MGITNRTLPENTSIVIPRLVCRDPAAELAFCVRALGAVSLNERPGPDGALAHALLKLGPEMVMIEAEWPTLPSRAPAMDGTSPVVIFVYVPNVDETVERATEHGATVLTPAADQFWGDRTALIMDPAGHVWTRLQRASSKRRRSSAQSGGTKHSASTQRRPSLVGRLVPRRSDSHTGRLLRANSGSCSARP